MPEVLAEQRSFSADYDERASEVMVWRTYGSGPHQTAGREAITC
ncbi:hypothetical protein [Streptomyces cucumeris]|nr:hypothetical protein [Streptomyces sp. NEAU-Y11]